MVIVPNMEVYTIFFLPNEQDMCSNNAPSSNHLPVLASAVYDDCCCFY